MNPLISIIVPVYNAESFIRKCVDSLCGQTYKNIEIILVDDGSPDNSGAICDELKQNDERIVVLHRKNEGVSSARNAGLDIMSGDFVTFVDSDDYVAENYIECLYNAIKTENADISTCGHVRINFDRSEKIIFSDDSNKIFCMSGIESLTNLFYGKVCSASSGSKLYNKSLFKKLRFPDYVMGEDTFIVYHTFSNANIVAHTNKALYYYVQHHSSVTNNKSNYYKFYDYVRLYDHIISSDTHIDNKDYFYALVNRLIENNFWVYMKLRNCSNLYPREKRHIEDNIKKYRRYVVCNPKAQNRVRMACLLSYGGMHTLDWIYDRINKNGKL